MQIKRVTIEHALSVLKKAGYTEVKETTTYNKLPIIEVTSLVEKITLVLFKDENNAINAFSSKVDHSDYSDPELSMKEEEMSCLLAA